MNNKCNYCGAPLQPYETECPYCHRPVAVNTDSRRTQRVSPGHDNPTQMNPQYGNPYGYQQNSYPPQNAARKSNTLMYVLIGALILVGSAIVTALILTNKSNHDAELAKERELEEREAGLDARAQAMEKAEYEEARQQQEAADLERRKADELLRHKKSVLADYRKILKANPNETYLMTDLNNNGFPELWISYRYGQHYDNNWHVYHSSNGHAKEICTVPDGAIARIGNSVYVALGEETYYKCTYNGSSVNVTTTYNVSFPYDQSSATTNFGPLESSFSF